MLYFRLLGPIEAAVGGRPVALGGAKPRALLAALLLDHGRVVSTSRLVDVIWSDDPPDSARALVQTYVSTLRQSFSRCGAEDVIVTRPPGYLIPADVGSLDLDQFVRLLAEGRARAAAGEHHAAAARLRLASGLWRGPAMTGLERTPLAGEARRLQELQMAATDERIAAELATGRLDHLAELTGLVARHPTHEHLRCHLMITLYRLGRQADALACFREGRAALLDELGIEPGPELSGIHQAILRGELPLPPHTEPASPADRVTDVTIPAQLPRAPADFTGRTAETSRLITALIDQNGGVHVVAGPGGIGKSALALAVAHHLAPSFPDGQLYAELRGMTDSPAAPIEVLGRFLRALGVANAQLPSSVEERAELFRSLVASRRILLVLDDARSGAQLQLLLPGGTGCAVLVTSRGRLAGLPGACLHELDLLCTDDARMLLDRLSGDERISGDEPAVAKIVEACGNLPLALRIVGAKLASRRRLPLPVLAARLSGEQERLDELNVADLSVRTSIGFSYSAVGGGARAALRRIGHFGVPSVSVWVVSLLMDCSVESARCLVEALVDAQLLDLVGVDTMGGLRYRIHDLVRLYAGERASVEDDPVLLRDAHLRVVQGWTAVFEHLAETAPSAVIRWRPAATNRPAVPDGLCAAIRADPQGWFEQEQAALVIGLERAATLGLHQAAYEFAAAQTSPDFAFRRRIVDAALAACRTHRDPQGEAIMMVELGRLRYDQGQFASARGCYSEALSLFREVRDVPGQATALAGLGAACHAPGHLGESLHFLDQAAALLDGLGDDHGVGYVRGLSGAVWLERGDFPAALADLQRSWLAYKSADNERGVGWTLLSLGLYHRALGDYHAATRWFTESAATFAACGDVHRRSYAIQALAKTQLRLGRAAEALPALEWVLTVMREHGDRFGQGLALRVLGQLQLSAGRVEMAEGYLRSAMSIWDTLEVPLWSARTQCDLAEVCRARGDHATAAGLRMAAWLVFREHGAREANEQPRPSHPVHLLEAKLIQS